MDVNLSTIAENSILIAESLIEHSFSTYQFIADRLVEMGFPSTGGNGIALVLFAISAILMWTLIGRGRNMARNVLLVAGGLFFVGLIGFYVFGLSVS